MRILGASSTQTVEGFLHAGYISAMAHPHGAKPSLPSFSKDDIAIQLDVDAALATEPVAQETTVKTSVTPGSLAPFPSSHGATPPYGHTAIFFGLLLGLCIVRPKRRLHRLAVAGVALAGSAALLIASLSGPSASADEPSRPVPPANPASHRRYLHPEQATQVILYGLLADEIAAHSQGLALRVLMGEQDVPAQRKEIPAGVGGAFPVLHPTARMKYAMNNASRDGWGNPFWLGWEAKTDTGQKLLLGTITSAGPDGQLDTDDDLSVRIEPGIAPMMAYRYQSRLPRRSPRFRPLAFFVRLVDGAPTLFFYAEPNQVPHSLGYQDVAQVQKLTGGASFDYMPAVLYHDRSDDDHARLARIPANLRQVYRETAKKSDALVLLVAKSK